VCMRLLQNCQSCPKKQRSREFEKSHCGLSVRERAPNRARRSSKRLRSRGQLLPPRAKTHPYFAVSSPVDSYVAAKAAYLNCDEIA
jgi:hypothetical protein